MAIQTHMPRRGFLKVLPVALTAPALLQAQPINEERQEALAFIEALEASQGWEPSNVVAAKHYAAYKMRAALGFDLPDPENAQQHVVMQRQRFEDHLRSVWHAEGDNFSEVLA